MKSQLCRRITPQIFMPEKKIKPVLESPECLLLGNISETCEFQIWKNGACLDQKSLCTTINLIVIVSLIGFSFEVTLLDYL